MGNALGDTIKQHREANNITLRELSRLCNISYSYIQGLESGIKDNPSSDVIRALSYGLKLDKEGADFLMFLARNKDYIIQNQKS